MFPEDRITKNKDGAHKLLADYNRALLENGYGFSRKALKAMDRIDLRPVCDYGDIQWMGVHGKQPWQFPKASSWQKVLKGEQSRALILETGIWSLMPPFEEGVLQLNQDRYLYFKLTRFPESETDFIGIRLHDHLKMHGGWMPSSRIDIRMYFRKEDGTDASGEFRHAPWVQTETDEKDQIGYDTVLQDLVPFPYMQKHFGWTERDMENFKTGVTIRADNSADVLIQTWNHAIWSFNILSERTRSTRAKRVRQPSGRQKELENNEGARETEPQKKTRALRFIGDIPVYSEKPVKPLSKRTGQVHYKQPFWGKRGHPRTLPNGKVIWIRPTTCRRKALMETDPKNKSRLPVTIRAKIHKEEQS